MLEDEDVEIEQSLPEYPEAQEQTPVAVLQVPCELQEFGHDNTGAMLQSFPV